MKLMEPAEFAPPTDTITTAVQRMESAFNRLPLAYKRLILFQNYMMVMGGLKAGTNYSFLGNTFTEADFSSFKATLESVGLKVTKPVLTYMRDGTTPFRQGYVFDPDTLRRETADSTLAPPYDGQMDLDEYRRSALSQGYNADAIEGKIYSFPESAIRDYIGGQKNVKGVFNFLKRRLSKTVSRYNETYWHYEPARADIIQHEKLKDNFFLRLNNNEVLKQIASNPLVLQSDNEWNTRLPDFTHK